MRAKLPSMLALATCGLSLVACSGLMEPPVPPELVAQVAPELSALGHPHADFVSAEIGGWNAGAPEQHQRYVDLAIRYQRSGQPAPNTMTVRIYHRSIEPCVVSLDVLEDDGPEPVLLDNALASQAIGEQICERLATRTP